MSGSERNTCAHTKCDIEDRRRRIRELNDGLRRYARAGIICITAGVQALGEAGVEAVLTAVRDFDDFTSDNDPYNEHDLGALTVDGDRMLWKIDYYDRDRRYGSPDPADPGVTTRVLTIMLASEY
jgi:hypothetical protein